jgi:peptidoglycan hydrolase-like protein with peptidoglycan-binding domain
VRNVLFVALSAGLLAGCGILGGSSHNPGPPPGPPAESAAPPVTHAPKPLGTSGMKSLQHALAAKGYYKGKVDGVNGPETKSAVARYQQDLGIVPVSGMVDDQTWSSLGLSEGK